MTALAHSVIPGPSADADTLTLIGSLGSTRAMWNPQHRLARHFRLLLVDLPGHGDSPLPKPGSTIADFATSVIALLDELSIDSTHVAGLSIGGAIAQQLAIASPERVNGVVALCTSARFGEPDSWLDRAATVRADGTSAIAGAVVGRWFTPGFIERNPAEVAEYTRMVADTDSEGYARCCEALAQWDSRADLGRIGSPTLVIGGAQDPATPPEHQRLIADRVATSRLAILDDAAHVASVEQAGAVNQLIDDFLRGTDERSAAFDLGMRTRRSVLGDAHVDRSVAGTTAFTEPFQDFITRVAWGDVWNRPGIDHQWRRLLTIAILTAVGNEHELDMHIRAALRAGVQPDLIGEVLLHTAVYAGVPNSNRAFALGKAALADLGIPDTSQADTP
ncbi:3-oxoadipate enol-lactonase [Gordonia jinhuaensis]|uniref:3-oxoadipate enol-lactonase n=1 Tax=Gordonia jinhuaensis TaxID=1517702 RepID=A0A916TAS5_9ACTN|nr:3-oxoadipate enol-lactonase [Gordonia jinhuaensis]GGB38307.1 3-oxoadipate enol-lactonase [Gordonia jinhuaensis]